MCRILCVSVSECECKSVCWFFRLFVCSFLRSFVRSFIQSFTFVFVDLRFETWNRYISTQMESGKKCSKQCNDLYSKQFLLYNRNIARLASLYASNASNIFNTLSYTTPFFGYQLNLIIRFSCCLKFYGGVCCVHQ